MDTLLLSSGGMKGISFLGVWKYIQERNLKIKTFSGVSAGALFSLFFVLGFSYQEIYDLIIELDFLELFDFNFINFFTTYGIISIERFESMVFEAFRKKGLSTNMTFNELFQQTNKELHTYAICVNTQQLQLFNHENTPDCKIWEAVKMSISIPLIFPPVSFNNCLYIDGALKNKIPLEFYNMNKTIPCLICGPQNNDVQNIFQYIYKIVNTIRDYHYSGNICLINIENGILDVHINKNHINHMINMGYQSISQWFDQHVDNKTNKP